MKKIIPAEEFPMMALRKADTACASVASVRFYSIDPEKGIDPELDEAIKKAEKACDELIEVLLLKDK